MIKLGGICAAAVLLLGAAPAAPPPPGFDIGRPQRTTERAGRATAAVEVRTLKRQADGAAVELLLVSVPAAKRTVTIAPVLKSGGAGALFREGPCRAGLAAVNGSFYLRDAKGARPLGLVRVDGRTEVQPSGRRFGGFLASDGRTARVLTRAARAEAVAARYALESTPILIRAGKDDMRSDDGIRFDRVAVGTTKSGATVIAGAFGRGQNALTLVEFGRFAQAQATAAGDPIVDLLAMDGGPSAHVHLPQSDRLFGHRGGAYLPNIVCVSGETR